MKQKIFIAIAAMGLLSISSYAQDSGIDPNDLFGDIRARHIGPAVMSGRINDLESHPTNPRIIYAGSAGGGVWKSNDAGATFNPIFDEYCQSIGAVELDPNDPDNVVYVGTGETWTRNSVSYGDGLYKSTDGGATWKKLGFDKSERIANIIVNPNNSNEVYVAVLGALWSDSEERGVYKSMDAGQTWEKILYVNENSGFGDLTVDASNPDFMMATSWDFNRKPWVVQSGGPGSKVFKTTDGGKTWKEIDKGLPKLKGKMGIAISPANPKIVYMAIEALGEKGGVYRSDNAGDSFVQTTNDPTTYARAWYYMHIIADPTDEDELWVLNSWAMKSIDG